jgi:hypothetical protein
MDNEIEQVAAKLIAENKYCFWKNECVRVPTNTASVRGGTKKYTM